MPKTIAITAPLREGLIECFRATTLLVRREKRRQLVLVGGAASVAHSSVYSTEDVDIAAPNDVIIEIWKSVTAGAPNFSFEPDGKLAFDASQGFRVRVDIIEIGEGIVEHIHVAESFFEGSVASIPDLLRLRAVSVVDRGSDGEAADFRWLLSGVATCGRVLPALTAEELEYICMAGRSCLGLLDRLVLFAVLNECDARVAFCRLLKG